MANSARRGLTSLDSDRVAARKHGPLRRPVPVRMCSCIMARSKTVLVVGGKGGLSHHYREAVEHEGYELVHYEHKIPAKGRHGLSKAAIVVVMVSMISHALVQQVQELTPEGAAVVYLKSPSVSALRAAVSGEIS